MRLLTLEFCKHLHGFLGNSTLDAVEDEKIFEWSAVQQLCFSAPALALVFATFGDETVLSLQVA